MNRYEAGGSPWRTPALILKFVVSSSGVSKTAEVFSNSNIICMAFIFSGMPYARIIRNSLFLSTESKAFKVDENNGSLFLVVSHFFDDAHTSKNLRICRSYESK